jgi:short-subunit dehydrogenase
MSGVASKLSRFGPWAVVTGASSGIGRELALGLARAGVDVVIAARNPDALASVAASIRALGREARIVVVDLASPEGPARLDEATGDLDVGLVVLNAGFGGAGPFLGAAPEAHAAMVDLNCRALVASSASFGRRLSGRGQGALVLLGSVVGFQGVPFSATYAATKAFVQTLGEALVIELGARGVDVLVAAPGPTESGFGARAGMRLDQSMSSETVAAAILANVGSRGTIFPGWLSKLLRALFMGLPRAIGARIFGVVMRDMSR